MCNGLLIFGLLSLALNFAAIAHILLMKTREEQKKKEISFLMSRIVELKNYIQKHGIV